MSPSEPGASDLTGDPADLITAVNNLTDRVETLTDRLNVSQRQTKAIDRQQRLILFLFVAGLMLAGAFILFGAIQWGRVTDTVEATQGNAVQGCENANETRAGQRLLWKTLFGLSQPAGPEEAKRMKALQDWIDALFAERDCTDLGREYPLPTPPSLAPPQ
jgi:hypothetical protein